MNSTNDRNSSFPLASEGGLSSDSVPTAEPLKRFFELMDVVEMLCPVWPPRELARGSDFRLSGKQRMPAADTGAASQTSLFGFEPPVPTDRLFFGLFPDPATAARIAALGEDVCRRHGLRVPRHQVGRLHVTLFHIGDWAGLPTTTAETAADAAAALRTAPFDVRFDEVVTFSGNPQRRPLVLKAGAGNEALHTFREHLGRELLKVGLGRCVTRTFEPHVTLAYAPQGVAAEAVEPIVWRATEFVLIHSLLGQTRYIPLGHWPLLAT